MQNMYLFRTHIGIFSQWKEQLPFATMEDFERIVLDEISQIKTNNICSQLYVESKKADFIEIEIRMMIVKS